MTVGESGQVRNHPSFYGSPPKVASAPERIEAGWWSDTQTRDYFIAEGQDHTLYWIACSDVRPGPR